MKPNTATADPGGSTPTHILIWLPLSKIKDGGGDGWAMTTYHDAMNGAEEPTWERPCFPKDAPLADLYSWVEATLGHPVVLVAGTETFKRRWRDWRITKLPCYDVYPE